VYCTASSVEMLCVDVVCFNSRFRFIVIYRPPHYGSNARDYENKLIESLESLCQVAWPVFIVGDLNCPGVNWQTNCAPLGGVQDKLLDCVVDYGFTQCVQLPTTRGANVLDLVLVNEPLLLSSLSVLDPVGNSDHDTVQFCMATTSAKTQECKSFAVLSSITFATRVNDVMCKLSTSGRGCHAAGIYFGVLMYADVLLLISSTFTKN